MHDLLICLFFFYLPRTFILGKDIKYGGNVLCFFSLKKYLLKGVISLLLD